MPISGVAIDCGWLCLLDSLDYGDVQDALQFLNELAEREVPLILDYDGHILAEYNRNFNGRHLGKGFVAHQMKRGHFIMHTGNPNVACRQALESLGFDPADVPYVGAAQHGAGLYLTHESKHLTEKRRKAIAKHCGVHVVDLAGARELLA